MSLTYRGQKYTQNKAVVSKQQVLLTYRGKNIKTDQPRYSFLLNEPFLKGFFNAFFLLFAFLGLKVLPV